jgi:hypothetical protein
MPRGQETAPPRSSWIPLTTPAPHITRVVSGYAGSSLSSTRKSRRRSATAPYRPTSRSSAFSMRPCRSTGARGRRRTASEDGLRRRSRPSQREPGRDRSPASHAPPCSPPQGIRWQPTERTREFDTREAPDRLVCGKIPASSLPAEKFWRKPTLPMMPPATQRGTPAQGVSECRLCTCDQDTRQGNQGRIPTLFRNNSNGLNAWRRERDSNPRDGSPPTHFPGVRLRPLGHLSVAGCLTRTP